VRRRTHQFYLGHADLAKRGYVTTNGTFPQANSFAQAFLRFYSIPADGSSRMQEVPHRAVPRSPATTVRNSSGVACSGEIGAPTRKVIFEKIPRRNGVFIASPSMREK